MRPLATRRLAALLPALVCAACSRQAERPLHAWIVTLDTTRADALSCAGAPSGLTPSLDALAREGVRFRTARSVAPLTLPAHASMMTGLYPPRHALRDNGLAPLSEEARTLAELAREKGFETAAVVASTVLDRVYALDQGFETWIQPEPPARGASSHFGELPAAEVAARAIEWLARRDRSRPFLLWTHFFDPHVPYRPGEAHLSRARGNAYLGEVAAVDDAVGAVLAVLEREGLLERTLIAVAGDHGESLGAHGEATHGAYCYDATLRVPLIVRLPGGARAGEVSESIASVADLMPTAAAALGLAARPGLDGEDLLGRIDPARGVYFESYSGWLHYGWSPLSGWADRDGKYLHSATPELYQPELDPDERRDVSPELGGRAELYRRAIADVAARPALASRADFSPGGELLAELRRLGYGTSGAPPADFPHPLEAASGRSPREGAHELDLLLVGNALLEERRAAEAVPLLEEILAANPGHRMALEFLGFARMQLGDFARAREVLERRLAAGRERTDTRLNLGICCARLGEDERAAEHFAAAHALDPRSAQALEELAAALERLGRADAARAARGKLEALGTAAAR